MSHVVSFQGVDVVKVVYGRLVGTVDTSHVNNHDPLGFYKIRHVLPYTHTTPTHIDVGTSASWTALASARFPGNAKARDSGLTS